MQSLSSLIKYLDNLPQKFHEEEEIFLVTEEINQEILSTAYNYGLFPWPLEEHPNLIPWFYPQRRGILDFKNFHVSRSLQKDIKKNKFEIIFNQDFDRIIKQCALQPRKGQSGTWINDKIIKSYCDLFKSGQAYCVGAYQNNFLVGGLYGVKSKNYYSGESMFHLHTNASKVCLVKLVERLKQQQIDYLDIQMVTPLLESFGAHYISREDFWNKIRKIS